MVDFGKGIYLTRQLDFELNESGDIRTTKGEPELHKDIAFNTIRRMDRELGQVLNPNTIQRAKVITKDVILSDPRVSQLVGEPVVREAGPNTLEIQAEANANMETVELVFEVDV